MVLIDMVPIRRRKQSKRGKGRVCVGFGVEGRRLEKDSEETGIADEEGVGVEDALAYYRNSCGYSVCQP
jgi:hypothetical protein